MHDEFHLGKLIDCKESTLLCSFLKAPSAQSTALFS
jgi:hypothetical protein